MAIESVTGVLCCGNICLDMPVWPVDRIAWGTTTWVDTIGESLGGNGANTSYTLARLGVPVSLTGVVGSDPAGAKILAQLDEAGIDISRIRQSELPTTSSVCVVHPSGDRLFLHKVGASTALASEDIEFDSGQDISHFHLANPFALPNLRGGTGDLMQRAKSAGLTTSLDAGWDASGRWIEDVGPGLPYTDLLFVNEREAAMLSGFDEANAAARELQRRGAGAVIVKIGGDGCLVFADDLRVAVPGFPVDVVDTTGAGDCFAGGFLAALQRDPDYQAAARFANAVGALNVQQLGAAQGVLSFDETQTWMESRSTL
jgi:sugar/nucleoside kinase (ribokinase family)